MLRKLNKKIEKQIEEIGIIKIIKIISFSSILTLATLLFMKINFSKNKININNIKVNVDKNEIENYPKTDSVWGVLEIPSLKINLNIYKGSDKLLKYGILHHSETYFPIDIIRKKIIKVIGEENYIKLTKINPIKIIKNEEISI